MIDGIANGGAALPFALLAQATVSRTDALPITHAG